MIRIAASLALMLLVVSSGTASASLLKDKHEGHDWRPEHRDWRSQDHDWHPGRHDWRLKHHDCRSEDLDCAPNHHPADAPPLQEILDDLVVSGPPIDANAPSGFESFEPTSSSMLVQLVFSAPDKGQKLSFGIYDIDDPNDRVSLFRTTHFDIDTTVTVSFLADGKVRVDDGHHSRTYGDIDGPFGFFVKVKERHEDPVYLFTEAELNGDEARAKVFQGNDQTRIELPGLRPGLFLDSQFLIAWETGLGCKNDGDFNDLIVSVSAITPLPEPRALVLFGLAVGALARLRRVRGSYRG